MATVAARPRHGERHFYRIAERVSGFGGYYYDDAGHLHAYLSDMRQTGALRAALRPVLAASRAGRHETRRGARRLQIHRGRFSFVQLAQWRDALGARGFSRVAGMHMIDVRESRNVVEVAVANSGDVAAVRALAAEVGLPTDALNVTIRPRERDLATLTELVTPFRGGLMITNFESGRTCTIGFNTYVGNHFVTASHCTRVVGPDYPTFASFVQPSPSTTYAYVGQESDDAPTFTAAEDPACSSGYNCRWSDVAIVAYPPSVGSQPLGAIYRVPFGGSKEIVGTFQIVAEADVPSEGMFLDKIGHATGWTYGEVSNACADIVGASGVLFICQGVVNGSGSGGDSGAPVFFWNDDDTITMHGILRGGTSTSFSFSPMSNIWHEFGYVPAY